MPYKIALYFTKKFWTLDPHPPSQSSLAVRFLRSRLELGLRAVYTDPHFPKKTMFFLKASLFQKCFASGETTRMWWWGETLLQMTLRGKESNFKCCGCSACVASKFWLWWNSVFSKNPPPPLVAATQFPPADSLHSSADFTQPAVFPNWDLVQKSKWIFYCYWDINATTFINRLVCLKKTCLTWVYFDCFYLPGCSRSLTILWCYQNGWLTFGLFWQ